MKNYRGLSLSLLCLALITVCLLLPGRPFAQDQIQKPKIFQETYDLINDTDLYCSFYMLEQGKKLPDIQIIGAERLDENLEFSDDQTVYINRGKVDGLEIGDLFQVIGIEEKVPPYGTVVLKRGRVRVVRLEDKVAVGRIEKSCNPVRVGDYLLPFEEQEGEIGKDKGYDVMDPNASKRGQVIYVENGIHVSAAGQWALIDLGRQHCVQIGDQLTVFHRVRPNLPREPIGSAIIIDVRGATATVKVLSSRDAVEVGNEVQLNVAR